MAMPPQGIRPITSSVRICTLVIGAAATKEHKVGHPLRRCLWVELTFIDDISLEQKTARIRAVKRTNA